MIVYIGNMLSRHGASVSMIELLGPQLQKHYTLQSFSAKRNILWRLFDMLQAVIKKRKVVKIVLIDSYSTNAFWYTYLIARLCQILRIPYIPILHGGDYPTRLRNTPRACRQVFQNSVINVSPSLYLKEHFEEASYKVKYIPNFLNIEYYPFKKRSKIAPRLFWVRAFHKTYNPTMAVDVVALLAGEFPDITLCMVGPFKDESINEVKEKANLLGVADRIKITGKLAKEDWLRLAEAYDIFINTTDYDNMPVSVIEAMALGLPVVSTNAGGLPYLIQHNQNGLLVDKGNAIQMAEQITRLLCEQDLAFILAQNARIKVEQFDWNLVAQQWRNILNPLVE